MRIVAWIAATLVALVAAAGAPSAKDKISIVLNIDPSHDAMTYALRTGKVKSDAVELELHLLDVNTAVQATSTMRFDIIQTSNLAVPRGISQGLTMTILGNTGRVPPGNGYDIWVKKDSPIKTVEDLKQHTLGTYSLGTSAVTLVRIALWKHYGLNVAVDGGDFSMKEMQMSALPTALLTDKVDAAMLSNRQAYEAGKSDDFRSIMNGAKTDIALFGVRPVSSVLVGFPQRMKGRRAAFQAALKLLRASRDYAVAHPDEVYPAVGKADDVDPEFLRIWEAQYQGFPVVISAADVKALDLMWQWSKELGILKEIVPAASTIWDGALRD